MPIDWSPFVTFVKDHSRFLIMTHVRPDGDALGSELALAAALRKKGKTARVVVASNLGPRYEFLNPGGKAVERFHPPGREFDNCDAIIVVDTGTWSQLGDFGEYMRSRPVGKAVIDHHRTQDDLGGLRFVDTTAEAAGRLVYEATNALGVKIDAEMAHPMFMALATDTGWFRHANTTPQTYALAEELMAAGARPQEVYEAIYEQISLPRMKLTGLALQRMSSLADGKIVWSEVRMEDYPATGAVPPDTEDLISYARSITGAEIAMIFIEQADGGTKVSFRGKEPHDVSKLAERFGGGGHKLAAGATVTTALSVTREAVLKAATEVLAIAR
ncbi:DHH family phosphoesterase [Zavarzinella formosa]|uniref:DHH family phosphoesterase n=1 Tax=Zavarzinella formosa TaxID=360055 RepID=UPI0003013B2B|nr:bifunctional oligoribonuclease/PAP phosphatase NrnA [Zavarzinella formosa]